ncbi:hypothetical protein HR45_19365 [Shewanella mangrovi]|uniref:Uncharacterized protein n=1 Tax=Shewanella mangrovi TaxID=1515746 RepID=A0A094J7M6_9GAMM|nr:hypothetical protein [Shewanella mangrovi]KFZ35910.1 hypothetical protein HR45_19365 [Shewanella mangrovi]
MKTYQFTRQHFASYLMAPLLLWLLCSIAWVQLALDSVPDSLRGKALFLVAAALGALAWLFARFFRFVSAPKVIAFDFTELQLRIDGNAYRLDELKYCLITQNHKAFKIALELTRKPAYASHAIIKSPQLYELQGTVDELSAEIAKTDNIELYVPVMAKPKGN